MKIKAIFILTLFLAFFLFSLGNFIPLSNRQILNNLPKVSAEDTSSAWVNTTSSPPVAVSGGNTELSCAPQQNAQGSGSTAYCLFANTTVNNVIDPFYQTTMSSGGFSAWTRKTAYPGVAATSMSALGMFFYQNDLMVVGGQRQGGSPSNVVETWNGAAWSANTSYPQIIAHHACASTTGLAVCVGGATNVVSFTKYTYTWTGSWSANNQFPIGIEFEGCVGYSGDVYCTAGQTNGSTANRNSYYTSDGITWTPTTSLPAGFSPSNTYVNPCTEDQGYIYCIDASATPKLYYAPLSGSGIGAWTQASNAPQKLSGNGDGVTSLVSYDNAAGAIFALYSTTSTSVSGPSQYNTPSFTFTETLNCKLKSTGGSSETVTLSGASNPSPTTATCTTGSTANSITVSPSAALTITVPSDGASSRYRGNTSWTSGTSYTFTTGSTAESHTLYNYQELPFNNPAGLSLTITNAGASNTTSVNTGWVDNQSSFKVNGIFSSSFTFPTAKAYIYQEGSQGFQILTTQTITNLAYDGTAGILSWTCSASCKTTDYIPGAFASSIQSTTNGQTVSTTISLTNTNYLSFNGNNQMSVNFQNAPGQPQQQAAGSPVGTTASNTQIQTTNSTEIINPNLYAQGACTSAPIVNSTTATSYTTVTYTSAGPASTFTTKIKVDHDDDAFADRGKFDRDDYRQITVAGATQNVTTTLTQFQTATITSQALTCSFTTTVTSTNSTSPDNPHPHPAIPPGSANSTNWAGYVVLNSNITDVKGTFIIPPISCGTGNSYIALWAGIDGYTSPTVEQGGVLGSCVFGSPSYFAWYEFYPSPMQRINMSVSPGDKMFVDVSLAAFPNFIVNIQDVSKNETFSISGANSQALLNSAEWITEAPSGNNAVLPLAAFGQDYNGFNFTKLYGSDWVTLNGSSSAIGYNPSLKLQLIKLFGNQSQVLAYPSALSPDQGSFIVYGPALILSNSFWWIIILILIIIGGIAYYESRNRNSLLRGTPKNRVRIEREPKNRER